MGVEHAFIFILALEVVVVVGLMINGLLAVNLTFCLTEIGNGCELSLII